MRCCLRKLLQQWKIKGKIAFIEKKSRNSFTLSWQVDEKEKNQQQAPYKCKLQIFVDNTVYSLWRQFELSGESKSTVL